MVRRASAAITAGGYCLWAVTRFYTLDDRVHDGPFILLSIIPFGVAVLVLEQALGTGRGELPKTLR